jgi:hypothetical protein
MITLFLANQRNEEDSSEQVECMKNCYTEWFMKQQNSDTSRVGSQQDLHITRRKVP